MNIKTTSAKKFHVAASHIHGLGLFASAPISAGTTLGRLQVRPAENDGAHVLWLSEDRAVEVTCDLKFINHSDRPNACYYDDLSVVALKDIEAGEEITHDYACVDW